MKCHHFDNKEMLHKRYLAHFIEPSPFLYILKEISLSDLRAGAGPHRHAAALCSVHTVLLVMNITFYEETFPPIIPKSIPKCIHIHRFSPCIANYSLHSLSSPLLSATLSSLLLCFSPCIAHSSLSPPVGGG